MALSLFQLLPDVKEDALHPKFKLLRDNPLLGGERNILISWTEGFIDRDNKIVKEFQTTFHSSFWEFYLFRMLSDAGFIIDFSHDRPDFIINAPLALNIEAVVSNIKRDGESEENRTLDNVLSMIVPPKQQTDFKAIVDEAIVRNSNAIYTKNKKYKEGYVNCDWIKPETPFVIALSSYDQIDYGREFLYPMMALLYGQYYDPQTENYDLVTEIIKPGTNSPIPIGIFNDPAFSHISGILFSCTTTLGKLTSLFNSSSESDRQFNDVLNIRHDHEAPHYRFQKVSNVNPEELSDGLFLFHNPLAKHKVPSELFRKTNALQVNITENGPLMEAENSPIISRINLMKGMVNKTLINLLYRDYNE